MNFKYYSKIALTAKASRSRVLNEAIVGAVSVLESMQTLSRTHTHTAVQTVCTVHCTHLDFPEIALLFRVQSRDKLCSYIYLDLGYILILLFNTTTFVWKYHIRLDFLT